MKNITGRNLYTIIAFSMMLLLLTGCVTKKKKGDVSKAAKMWHNTNAHYNGWFNANELMVASEAKLIDQYSENYNEILPIYPSYKAPKPESVAQDLDKAIEKVSVVAVRHEVSQWVDDCYIILGKAQFLKQDYESAEETFAYFVEEFDPSYARRKKNKSNRNKKAKKKKSSSKPKKVDKYGNERTNKKKKSKKSKVKRDKSGRKKVRKDPKTIEKPNETAEQKEERLARERAAAEKLREEKAAKEKELENTVSNDNGSSGIFKHLSSFPEGLLWLAKTYVEREKYSLVDFYLNKIADQSEVSKEVLKEVPVVRAYNEMEQEHYAAAIPHLEEAINLEKDKKTKARYIYILAQIQQKLGNQKAAFAGFNKVIDMKPDFLMEFNAALNMLKSSMGEGESSLATAESKLNKMLEEDKFLNFRDQIYFTLGEIRFSRNEIDEAIPNFRKSIKFNTGNTTQLVESYYILANIFYDKEDYVMSKNYYDSTSTVINKRDDRYFEVQAFATNLKGIAENINTIELQDSLIALANKTPEQRAEIAAQIKKEQLLAEAAAEARITEQEIDLAPGSIRQVQGRSISPGSRTSTWFAYDPNKVRIGKDDFKRDWGFRNLEDDWRRSEKSSGVNTASSFDEDDEVYLTEEEINEIMKDVPLTADAMTQAKLKIREALYDLGVQYRDKIQNYNKAIEAHESLQSRFPGSEKEPDALYYLYLSHNDVSQPDRANYYLNQLKSKYPEEKYTLALTDPNYVENFLQESKIQERLYNQAYSKFQSGEFTEVLSMEKSANEKFNKNNTFASKYALLSAMAIGNLEGKEKYIAALKNMIATYPNTDEQTRAREILRFLNGDEEAFAEIDKGEAIQEFTEDNDKLHYIIVVVNAKKDSDINAAKISVSNYNRKYHKTERIKTSSSTLNKDNNTQLVLLRKFSGKEDAMKYYNEVDRNKKEFMEPKVNFQVFAITQKNFREIMKKKSIKEYEIFFNERYLEQAE